MHRFKESYFGVGSFSVYRVGSSVEENSEKIGLSGVSLVCYRVIVFRQFSWKQAFERSQNDVDDLYDM